MADDPVNQQQFAEDVLAASEAGDGGDFGDPNGNFQMPSVDEVWKLIEQMEGISDEERASIRENLYNPQDGTAEDFMKRYAQPAMGHTSWDYIIFFTMLAIIIAIFVGGPLRTTSLKHEVYNTPDLWYSPNFEENPNFLKPTWANDDH